jgi:flagellar protein FlbB
VAEYTGVRPGPRIFLLFLLLLVLSLGGIIWFDYLGLIDARGWLTPVLGLFGARKTTAVAAADDPNLLALERMAKDAQALQLRQQELDTREAALSQKEQQLNQLGQDLADKEKALADQEKAFIDQQKAFENRSVTLVQNAKYLMSMEPLKVVAILKEMSDQDVIDNFRTVEAQAATAGVDSPVPYWMSLMEPARAATLQRKMTRSPGGTP